MSTDASADGRKPGGARGWMAGRQLAARPPGTTYPPAKRRRRIACASIAALLLGPLGLVAISSIGSTPVLAAGPTITGAGSSYAAVAIQNWAAQVSTVYGDSVDYSVSSSVIGLNLFAQNQVTFGATEIGYSTGQANYTPSGPYQYLPDIAGATCLMYNVTGRLGNQITSLNLNSKVLADIWTGTVTTWNAPQIAALNPGVDLPDQPIIAVFRTDASGENYIFSQYLDYLQPQIWVPFVQTLQAGDPVSAIFPSGTAHGHYNLSNFVGQNGSDGASDFVASVNYSMTYVETAYAILHNKPCAYVQNASGNWVQPSEETDAVGLERDELLPDLEQKLQGVYSNPLPDAYPISAYSYLVTADGPGSMSPAVGAVLGQFIRFYACTGQNAAGALGYSPLPPNLVDADFAAINRLPGAARAPAEATAANCSDPYVDGQTHLPGEPCIQGTSCSSSGGGGGGGSGGGGGGGGGGGTTTTTSPGSGSGTTPGSGSGTTPGSGSGTTPARKGTGSSKAVGAKRSTTGQHFGGTPTPLSAKTGKLWRANGQWPGEQILPGAQPDANLSNGQVLGSELASADFTLLGVKVSPATMWGSVALLILLLALPPSLARLRKRRKLSRLEAATSTGGPS